MLNTLDTIADAYDIALSQAQAHRYDDGRPAVPNYITQAYSHAARWIGQTAAGLARATGYTISPCTIAEPYFDAVVQARTTRRQGTFYVSTLYCDHALFLPADNVNLRVVHDWIGHAVIDRSVAPEHVPGFDTAGEVHAWRRLRHYLEATTPYHQPGNRYVWHVLFAELIGQTAYYHRHASFPTLDGTVQPALLLDGFDPRDGVDL